MSTELTLKNEAKLMTEIDQVLAELPETKSIKRAKDISTHAQLLKRAADAAQVSPQLRAILAEVQLRGRYRAGQLLAAMPKGRPKKSVTQGNTFVSLEELGINRKQSSEWQRIAKIPERELDALIRDRGEDLTTADALALAKRLDRGKKKKEKQRKRALSIPTDQWTIEVADIVDFYPSDQVDAIITDPPYPYEFLHTWKKLGEFAARSLREGGLLLAMSGQSYLPEIYEALASTSGLTYRWTLAYLTPGGQAVQLWDRKVNTFWKPVLCFRKGDGDDSWFGDVLKSDTNDNDKFFHHWGQSESGMADLVDRVTAPGDLVCDPFVGGGTTAFVAAGMGRRFVGCDIDAQAVRTARKRMGS